MRQSGSHKRVTRFLRADRLAAWLLGLGLAFGPLAAQAQEKVDTAFSAIRYDLDSTTGIACVFLGQSHGGGAASIWSNGPIPLIGRIKTSGSSTTVSEYVTNQGPFSPVSVGDVVVVPSTTQGQEPTVRLVTAKASSASITVDTAVDWSATGGKTAGYYKASCGTTAEDGWVSVSGYQRVTTTFEVNQMNGTGGIDASLQCRNTGPDSAAVQIDPDNSSGAAVTNFSSAGLDYRRAVVINADFDQCRWLMLWHTSDDGTDTGSAREQINISWRGYRSVQR